MLSYVMNLQSTVRWKCFCRTNWSNKVVFILPDLCRGLLNQVFSGFIDEFDEFSGEERFRIPSNSCINLNYNNRKGKMEVPGWSLVSQVHSIFSLHCKYDQWKHENYLCLISLLGLCSSVIMLLEHKPRFFVFSKPHDAVVYFLAFTIIAMKVSHYLDKHERGWGG